MTIPRIVSAALELQAALIRLGRPFTFIGGLAVQRWGEPRLTVDADATVFTAFEHDESCIDSLLSQFRSRRIDSREFALANRVLLLTSSDGTHLDVSLGGIPFEERLVARSSVWRYAPGADLRTCSAEDLIVLKCFAARDRDWVDVFGIIARNGAALDRALILDELRPLAAVKEDPAIMPRIERLLGPGTA
jgi:hypothetical protein